MTLLSTVISLVEKGHNIVLHGPGGVGKSYTICHLVQHYREKGIYSIQVTALTGVAAVVLSQSGVKARTLHSWAGVGLADKSAETLAGTILNYQTARARWQNTSVLIIDEMSMMGHDFFEKLDTIGRIVRKCDKPFGGIQLVLSGDFLQNPPINAKYIFMSELWPEIPFTWLDLTVPKRYSDPVWFQRLLRFRLGTHTQEDWDFLKTRHLAWNEKLKELNSGKTMIMPTNLKAKKRDVRAENELELHKLPGEPKTYISEYLFNEKKGGRMNREYVIKMFEDQVEHIVNLKPGAQVMLKKNMDVDLGLVNGSRGIVTQIEPVGVEVLWVSGRKTWVAPAAWEYEDDDGEYKCIQIPLVLAWTATIHKSQSATLDSVAVDLSDIFGTGQAYVGLSRVREEQGLFVTALVSSKKINASKVVLDFLREVEKKEPDGVITEVVVT